MSAGVLKLSDENRPRVKPSTAKSWLKAIELTSRIEADPNRLFADVVEDHAARQPDCPALLSDAETFSYRELADRINRYARWALAAGIAPGDTVCLFMPGGPEYIAMWLGITKVGGVAALINTKLIGPSLSHCIDLAQADHAIIVRDLAAAFETAIPYLSRVPKIWIHRSNICGASSEVDRYAADKTVGLDCGAAAGETDIALETVLKESDGSPLTAVERRGVTIDNRALLIYTSGTTGLPKAANISHRRILNWGGWFAGLTGAVPDDRLYDCLPLFHSVGGIVAPCSMLSAGASVVLSEKFSASQFWDNIARWDCTMFQYIGELCRYLLKAPQSASENRHRLRLACGNGLRGDIWEAFAARFAVPRILEFYAATEGNFSLYNVEGKPGAIGRIPPLLAHRFPAAIIRVDPASGEAVRRDGLCVACARGEVGEAVGRIGTADAGGGRFEGYTDAAQTEKKILRNVMVSGDVWFRTGDLMRLDEAGYFYFVDRIGDTFRWKGENVSTSEVNEAVASCPGVVEATTYGVAIPGADGRAGMTTVVIDAGFDLEGFADHLLHRLPLYACPVVIRIAAALHSTETFKQKKQALAHEGFDPHAVTDPLFYRESKSSRYRPIDAEAYARIRDGAIRL